VGNKKTLSMMRVAISDVITLGLLDRKLRVGSRVGSHL
jgi:hypothetical protein